MKISTADIQRIQRAVWLFYKTKKRTMTWRKHITPYRIVVSEIMLQQTQVSRVEKKFSHFVKQFPSWRSLARASQSEVLAAWSGLGYNRRALYLHQIAKHVVETWNGKLPRDPKLLQTLPGIGAHTAGSIVAFAFNMPVVFIETNIRTVFLYHCFKNKNKVSDRELMPYIEATLDHIRPRAWYWALMDYGAYIKKTYGNQNTRSKQYTKQTTFHGSIRQLRGMIVRDFLKTKKGHTHAYFVKKFKKTQKEITLVLKKLEAEGFIHTHKNTIYKISDNRSN